MSASDWDVCPKCRRDAASKYVAASAKARASYAKVTLEEYHSLLAAAQEMMPPRREATELTLREDYQLGVDSEGTFTVSYKCSCQHCGFEYSFKQTEKVSLGDSPRDPDTGTI